MPIYAYACEACGHRQDHLQKMADAVLTVCPSCGAAAYTKQLSAPPFQLKGGGWYVTDFRDGGKKDAKKSDADGKGGGASATDGKSVEGGSAAKSDTKTESKGESKSESKGDAKSDTANASSAASSTSASTSSSSSSSSASSSSSGDAKAA